MYPQYNLPYMQPVMQQPLYQPSQVSQQINVEQLLSNYENTKSQLAKSIEEINRKQEQLLQNQNRGQTQLQQQSIPQQQVVQPRQDYLVRFASNYDEVKSTPLTDSSGMPDLVGTYIFLNLAQGEIYTSKLNNMGSKEIFTFKLDTTPPPEPQPEVNVSMQDLLTRLERLESAQLQQPGGIINESELTAVNESNTKRGKSSANTTAGNTEIG